jgi:hypothetical protein
MYWKIECRPTSLLLPLLTTDQKILRTNALEGLAFPLKLGQKYDRDDINEIKDTKYSCRGK